MMMRMMIILLQLVLVMIAAASPSPSPSSGDTVMCRPDERDALLSFKSSFSIYKPSYSDFCIPLSWEKDGNCCEWDGVVCDPQTGHVVELDLYYSCLSGSIPSNTTLFRLPNLQSLDLAYNYLSGQVPQEIGWLSHLAFLSLSYNDQLTMPNFQTIISNLTDLIELRLSLVNIATHLPPIIYNLSNLAYLGMASCGLEGEISDGIFELHNLEGLNLEENNLTGTIMLSKIHKFQLMDMLILSDNKLSIIDDMDIFDSKPSFPMFYILSLSSCNLGRFPDFLRQQANLTWLELSNNNIHGSVPNWLSTLGALRSLNLSHNSLHGGLEHLPWQNMQLMDIQNNLFHGNVPVPSPTTSYFWASNNNFTGAIPHSLCKLSNLGLLDLALNNLTGGIPNCFVSLVANELKVLDLRENQLEGEVPSSIFQKCPNLHTLSLSDNKLEGPIPQSIKNCLQLRMLDLSSNIFNDTFPHWLGFLPSLKVLNLGSNNFHGSLMASNNVTAFSTLQILDISNNDFMGCLPVDLLMSMKAMVKVNSTHSLSYLGVPRYRDSVKVWLKGIRRQLDEICDALVVINASQNKLEGPIPDVIGDLVSLRSLNLAHNTFTGHIPSSLSNLTLLESLDLSFNRLNGRIPIELVNLNSLALFNVSENNLVGLVPTTKQFGTFSDPSYLGNPGLCGPWLTNKCGNLSDAPQNLAASEGSGDESSSLQMWEIGLIGCGCGLLGGLAWGYIIFWVNSPYWVQRLIFQIETIVIGYQRRKRPHKTRRTKKRDTQGRWI